MRLPGVVLYSDILNRRVFAEFFDAGEEAIMKIKAVFAAFLVAASLFAEEYFPRNYGGIDPAAVMAFVDAVDAVGVPMHSFLFIKDGEVVAEGAWSPYTPNELTALYSLTKPMVSIAAGFAIQEGKISLDDPVIKFFPDDLPAELPAGVADIKFRHLLSMTSGHDEKDLDEQWGDSKSYIQNFFSIPLAHEPGTNYIYGFTSDIAAKTIARAVGMPLADYLQPRLFEPLGITEYSWSRDKDGDYRGGSGLSLALEDIGKVGVFCLQSGMWEGKQLLNAEWFDLATQKHADVPWTNPDWKEYGLHLWRDTAGNFRGDGWGGQLMIMMREENAVLVISESTFYMAQIVYNIAYHTLSHGALGKYVARKEVSPVELAERLAKLTLPVAESIAKPALPERFTIKAETAEDAPAASWEFEISADGVTATQHGMKLFHHLDGDKKFYPHHSWAAYADGNNRLWTRSAWIAPDELILYLYANPIQTSLTFKFTDDKVTVTPGFYGDAPFTGTIEPVTE